jgi:WD40-like Beta Propeller Repeat
VQDELEALIREARERQRRRRLRAAVAALALGTVAAASYGIARVAGGASSSRSPLTPVVDAHAFAGHGRLAFVSRGRLWVLDGTTGKLVNVTGSGASAPAFSPDGRWLSYAYRGHAGLARADGAHARTLRARSAKWLPDGRLLLGRRALYRVSPSGVPVRVGTAPAGLVAWAPDGSAYAFVGRSLARKSGQCSFRGVERLELADSLGGRRTLWHQEPISCTPSAGFRGEAINGVVVLPRRRGVLFWFDPMQSASLAADGMAVYELTASGAAPVKLGTTVGTAVSLSRTGRFALGGGFDRIAWVTKTALACHAARCKPVRPAAGSLTLDPALTPDGSMLAFVSAASEGTDMGSIQPLLKRWYATRRLWVGGRAVPDSTGAAAPVWSSDGRSLLFVKDDALWLLSALDTKPVRVAAPLFGSGIWPNSMGKVPWSAQFAWQS